MKTVVISLLGTSLDNRGVGKKRWSRWRPTLSLCQHQDLVIDRLELLFQANHQKIADILSDDIRVISPETQVKQHLVTMNDPWDFESVYAQLLDFSRSYPFKPEAENYLIHITTGTHVAQICLYLLTEAHYLPTRLIQTSPSYQDSQSTGSYQIIDLDLSKYDQIASRFSKVHQQGRHYLKDGIATRNPSFNQLIEQLEKIAICSKDSILLTGASGTGKSQLAKRIYELKKQRGQLTGVWVEVNCATLRGDHAMSALFGHLKGAFTGAITDRKGLLAQAHEGLLFLDEIGELGLDEQAMLLHAIEEKKFMPFGSDEYQHSDFQLIIGTNRLLIERVQQGLFREDLLARINLWAYRLPSLKERIEDLEPNLEYELEKYASKHGSLISFNTAAKTQYLAFSKSPQAIWQSNFRDLNASITRMATLASGGRITVEIVEEEITRLQHNWDYSSNKTDIALSDYVEKPLDRFEEMQLEAVIKVCQQSKTIAEAGRKLFNHSRLKKTSPNDSHRLRQFLSKYSLSFKDL